MSLSSIDLIFVWLCFRHGAGQLKIMFIGGPNQRKDYHIEEGEEVCSIVTQCNLSSRMSATKVEDLTGLSLLEVGCLCIG